MFRRQFKVGDWVVYRRMKVTTHPGRRAHGVDASANGDDYNYFVDKFWIVAEVLADRNLLLKTRRGKTHVVGEHDLNLRHASLWDRIRYRQRYVELQQRPCDTPT
jgi:hypothetical protein